MPERVHVLVVVRVYLVHVLVVVRVYLKLIVVY